MIGGSRNGILAHQNCCLVQLSGECLHLFAFMLMEHIFFVKKKFPKKRKKFICDAFVPKALPGEASAVMLVIIPRTIARGNGVSEVNFLLPFPSLALFQSNFRIFFEKEGALFLMSKSPAQSPQLCCILDTRCLRAVSWIPFRNPFIW